MNQHQPFFHWWRLPVYLTRFLIWVYRHTFSLVLGPRCKYYPSCSQYADLALQIHGFCKGLLLTAWRLLRCNPFSDGGVDYPPIKGQWRNPWKEPGSVTQSTYSTSQSQPGLHRHNQGVLSCY